MPAPLFARDEAAVLFDALDRAVTCARLRFALPDRVVDVGARGDAARPPDHVLRVRDRGFARRVLIDGNLGLAESFMDEHWSIERGSLEGFLEVLLRSGLDRKMRRDPRLVARVAAMRLQSALRSSRDNITLHYDLGDDIYAAFLDESKAYTCGYQAREGETLAELQANKFDRVCEKLALAPGETLFDIGCGYGGFVIHAARKYGVRARGITVSRAQQEGAMRRVRELGLEGRVVVDFGDFREARGVYDKVVSIGMFEHLREHEYPAFFRTVDRLLAGHGVALLHSIGCFTARNEPDPFTQKYLFPGATFPSLSAIVRQLEKRGWPILDVENIARSYQPTTRHWLANFRRNQHTLDPARYDARFRRMFEYYLAMCVAATHALIGEVFQILFTRDYERHLRFRRV